MKTIKSLKDITTLEVDDKVVFGNLEYSVRKGVGYFLHGYTYMNSEIFKVLNINKRNFIENLGIDANHNFDFPETKSLEALTAIVSALFKEYEKHELPKTWEEFCDKYHIKEKEVFINSASDIDNLRSYSTRTFRLCDTDKNLCTSKQEAEAFLALMQLRQLRKCYVGDWEPNWLDCRIPKYSITYIEGVLSIFDTVTVQRSMSFPNSKLAKQFLNNFKDLLEIAKPLL